MGLMACCETGSTVLINRFQEPKEPRLINGGGGGGGGGGRRGSSVDLLLNPVNYQEVTG